MEIKAGDLMYCDELDVDVLVTQTYPLRGVVVTTNLEVGEGGDVVIKTAHQGDVVCLRCTEGAFAGHNLEWKKEGKLPIREVKKSFKLESSREQKMRLADLLVSLKVIHREALYEQLKDGLFEPELKILNEIHGLYYEEDWEVGI